MAKHWLAVGLNSTGSQKGEQDKFGTYYIQYHALEQGTSVKLRSSAKNENCCQALVNKTGSKRCLKQWMKSPPSHGEAFFIFRVVLKYIEGPISRHLSSHFL